MRRFPSSSKRKSAKDKQQRFVIGEVIKQSGKSGNYQVRYVVDGQKHEDLISVSDLTSVTLQEEKIRRQNQSSINS